jgi:hypothetical protein
MSVRVLSGRRGEVHQALKIDMFMNIIAALGDEDLCASDLAGVAADM